MNPLCIYHSNDLDGKCSAAIVSHALRSLIELHGMDYGDVIPWDKIRDRSVIMVDFCFQPFDDMEKLRSLASNFVWIDHHKSSLEEAERRGFNPKGLRSVELAACELTWNFFFKGLAMPVGVQFLGRYDVWKHEEHPGSLAFQYGMRSLDTQPRSGIWKQIFYGTQMFVDETMQRGRIIQDYVQDGYKAKAKMLCFETELEGFRLLAANNPYQSSQFFEGTFDLDRHDIMCSFYKRPDGLWTISFYSTKTEVDCSELAKKYGGGGHKGAAGCQCRLLPWESIS